MLACNLDRNNEIPLYDQLYNFIKNEIIEGRIAYGEKLPSKRKLAEFLNISLNTVETAYDQLIAEGYVKSVPRKGYFVLAYEDLDIIKQADQQVEMNKQMQQEIKYNFHPNWIDTEHFPFTKWRKYTRKTLDSENQSLLLLGDSQGEYALRREISNYLYQARGVKCTPENIVIGAGVETLLQLLIQLFGPETTYGVEDPGYHAISRILKNFPNEIKSLEVDDEGVQVETIKKLNPDIVYVTPSHHFPYGYVLSVNRRIKLLNWAAEASHRYIIEDDYDSEFRYSGKTIPSLQSMDQSESVIYLGTFSKMLIPSIRVSYMVLPHPLLKRYREKLSFYQCTVSRFAQHTLTQFMEEGEFERHLNRMRKVYRRKLEKTLDLLKQYQNTVDVIQAQSGFHVVLVVKNGMSEKELVERALKNKIKVYPLSHYSLDKQEEEPAKIVLGFAGMPEAQLETAIEQLFTSWGIEG